MEGTSTTYCNGSSSHPFELVEEQLFTIIHLQADVALLAGKLANSVSIDHFIHVYCVWRILIAGNIDKIEKIASSMYSSVPWCCAESNMQRKVFAHWIERVVEERNGIYSAKVSPFSTLACSALSDVTFWSSCEYQSEHVFFAHCRPAKEVFWQPVSKARSSLSQAKVANRNGIRQLFFHAECNREVRRNSQCANRDINRSAVSWCIGEECETSPAYFHRRRGRALQR